MTCDVCGQPLDPDIAHTPHRDGCDHHDCPCDTVVCPGCCATCKETP